MAMLQMQRVFIYALKKNRKQILEKLQRRGVIEINDMLSEDNVFQKSDVSNAISKFERNISLVNEALEILQRYAPEKKPMLAMLQGRKDVSVKEYDSFRDKYDTVLRIANYIISCNREIAENKAEVLKLETQIEMLKPWTDFDIPLGFTGTRSTSGFIGTFPQEWSLDEIYEKLAMYMPFHVEIISSSKNQTCIFLLCRKENAEAIYEALRNMEFSHPGITSKQAPAQMLEELSQKIDDAKAAIDEAQKKIQECETNREDLQFLLDYEKMRQDKYEIIGHLLQSSNVFVLSGYIPQKEAAELEKELTEQFDIAVEFDNPSEDDDVPVLLQNNGFAAPLEGVVEGFSLPAKGEIDPTMVMALFYYVLFGIMLADFGYGALIVIACGLGLVKFGKSMEPSMRNNLKMFLFCGISTMFWGAMFGSYFGDLIDVIATTYFGATKTPIIAPLWFFPVNKPMQMLTFSMAFGLVHLLTGLAMKTYQLILQKDYIAILYDTVSWFALIVSSTLLLLNMDMITGILGISVSIPSVVAKASGIIAILSSVIIVLTNGRESKNPFKRFLKGAYALYGITGYLSDVLSYSRLLALGLASGVICSVVNKMAGMAGKGVIGPIIFIVIILVGHILNFAINILGAYVHTNRLQYVEFFGKFYEGGGRSFNPFNMKTKYYKIKEKM
ncbi:V-type ATP synthase subunit I [Lachnospiraceae bacterium MD1]|uniref:V-type ATP synthase subunit I n=1 Tax=Variimorphobacter saccharofermentans TaxID=2755051 RepID=A0A839K2F2_9FIRM|nr:V-type ATP synthase subunit I [Variimorphobacter saccharofermentans]MBB2183169.1 V-type ATP synthase subunit I [Variimorphobacter saccharofermentans]